MPFNRHEHFYGENSKGKFCLICGDFFANKEKKDSDDTSFFSVFDSNDFRENDVLWPSEEGKNHEGYLKSTKY